MIVLSNIFEIVDRSIYDKVRAVVVEAGYWPDLTDSVRYPNNPTGVQNLKDDVETIKQEKGFAIEVFGAATNEKRYEKKVPRIVYLPKRILPGDLGGTLEGSHEFNEATQKFKVINQPTQTTSTQFEISLVSGSIEQKRVLDAIISASLSRRAYIPFYNLLDERFFVVQTTYREFPDTEFGILEYIYAYEARDIWDYITVAPVEISPLSEVTVEVRSTGTDDTDDPDSTIIVPD